MGLQVDIKKKIGKFSLDVSFTCDNSVTAVLGASGSGKSMTLKCIAGIETPDEGKIVLNGRVLFDSEKKTNIVPQKRKVGYMFQDYALFPNMTVCQNIEIACEDKNLVESYLNRFMLIDVKSLYPSQLSGGQKQRVAMARMLAAKPEMIILDEPFSALDSHLKWQMENEVRHILKEEGMPAIFVSHDRDEVYRLSELAGVITDGKMRGVQNTGELFRNPGTKSAAVITGCKNVARAIKKDDNTIIVPDWEVELETKSPVLFDEGYVGIRAHSFESIEHEDWYKNCFEINKSEIIEEPFEWNISFQMGTSAEWLQWKISKEVFNARNMEIPKTLWISPEKIMLLEKD